MKPVIPSTELFVPTTKIRSAADLGAAIRRARKAQGVGLVETAGLAGVGVRFLSELERGKSTASLGKALQVLGRVGLDLTLRMRGAPDVHCPLEGVNPGEQKPPKQAESKKRTAPRKKRRR